MTSDTQERAFRIHCLGKGETVAHGNGGCQSGGIGVKIRSYRSTDGSYRDTALTSHINDTAGSFAHQGLGIETSLAGNDKIGTRECIGKAIALKDIRGSGQEVAVKQVHHQRGDASCGATTGLASDFLAHNSRHMHHAALQLLDLLGRGPFLRRENPCRATLTAQGVVHIGQEGETAIADQLRDAQSLDMRDSHQALATGIKMVSVGIKEFSTQGTQDAHGCIAGRRTSQAQHDVTAATFHGVTHQQARSQCTRPHHITPIGRQQGQSTGGSHLDESGAIIGQEIGSIDGSLLQQRAHRGHSYPLALAFGSQYRRRTVATISNRDTDGSHIIKAAQVILHGLVKLLGRYRSLEFVKSENDLHLALDSGCDVSHSTV